MSVASRKRRRVKRSAGRRAFAEIIRRGGSVVMHPQTWDRLKASTVAFVEAVIGRPVPVHLSPLMRIGDVAAIHPRALVVPPIFAPLPRFL